MSQVTLALGLIFSPVAYLAESSTAASSISLSEARRLSRRTGMEGYLRAQVLAFHAHGIFNRNHISGIPQIVYKIPLDAKVSDRLTDLDFPRIFDRLIVGPTSYPWPKKAGVDDAEKRLCVSGIPIRA